MIRFLSGFIIGYMAAKRPPTKEEVEQFGKDIHRLVLNFVN